MLRPMKAARAAAVPAVVACALALADLPARAIPVQFTASGGSVEVPMSNGLDATVTLGPRTQTIDLVPGVPQEAVLNFGEVDAFLLGESAGAEIVSQTINITGATAPQSVSQPVAVDTTGGILVDPTVSAVVGPGTTVLFNVPGQGFFVQVTPDGGSLEPTSDVPAPFENSARFVLTVIPEPTGAALALAGAAGLVLARRRRPMPPAATP